MTTGTDILKEAMRDFDALVLRNMDHLYSDISEFATEHKLSDEQTFKLIRKRCGEIEDTYRDWLDW